MSNQVVPQGYKQTKVGVIPEEWEVVKLGDIATFYKGKGISKKDISEYGTPCIRYGELYTKYDEKIQDVFSKTNLDKEDLFLSQENDILIPASGETAIDLATASCVLKNNIGIGGDINIIRSTMNGIFLSYYLNIVAKIHIASLAQGVSVIHLYSSQLKSLYIVKPPLKEQQKIAEILTTWDSAISKQEELVKAKEELKKGLMQKLLSGELRFGGFDEEWEEVRLGDFLTERNIKTPKSKEYPLMAFVANKGVAHKGERYNREFLVSDSDNKKYKQTEYGDFIYSSNNLETGSIGLNLYGSASISPVYSIFQIQDPHSYQFMGSFLVKKSLLHKMIRYRQGVIYGQWRIHESDFLKIKERIPSPEEQQKIAQVLSNADKEITLLKEELEALKEQKRGLMQRLLSGGVRVKV